MLDTLTLRAAQTQNEPPVESSLGVEPTDVEARDSSPDADPPQIPQPVRREPRPCESKNPVLVLAYRALDASFDAQQRELPRVWAGDTVTGVHRMRMATRRTRAVLRAFRDILPRASTASLASESAWLAGELGPVRDLDVYLARLDEGTAHLPPELRADLEPHIARVGRRAGASRAARASRDLATGDDRRVRTLSRRGPSAAALRRSRASRRAKAPSNSRCAH
jgi:uncharacterized protein (DUF2267 family)